MIIFCYVRDGGGVSGSAHMAHGPCDGWRLFGIVPIMVKSRHIRKQPPVHALLFFKLELPHLGIGFRWLRLQASSPRQGIPMKFEKLVFAAGFLNTMRPLVVTRVTCSNLPSLNFFQEIKKNHRRNIVVS